MQKAQDQQGQKGQDAVLRLELRHRKGQRRQVGQGIGKDQKEKPCQKVGPVAAHVPPDPDEKPGPQSQQRQGGQQLGGGDPGKQPSRILGGPGAEGGEQGQHKRQTQKALPVGPLPPFDPQVQKENPDPQIKGRVPDGTHEIPLVRWCSRVSRVTLARDWLTGISTPPHSSRVLPWKPMT